MSSKPGDPAASLLIQTIKHEHEDLKMPKAGAKLDDKVIADFEQWIRDGAADPRDAPPSKEQVAKETDWKPFSNAASNGGPSNRSRSSLRTKPSTTTSTPTCQTRHPCRTTSRCADTPPPHSYVLTGLPPSDCPTSQTCLTQLLLSPAFGEKWARHFMDWVRYAESYGSEGDPAIPYAWRYRDYLIRAFNDDVPYPQLVKEAIAGDLLPNPRLKNGINESAIGIAQLRMVLHGFSPVDSLDEMVTFTDNQIDTVTKAFQALTVSCARCHNHKFDAISQADFYALYGIFTSTHPAVIDVNAPGTGDAIRAELKKLKAEIKTTLITDWLKTKLPSDRLISPKRPVSQKARFHLPRPPILQTGRVLSDRKHASAFTPAATLKRCAQHKRPRRALHRPLQVRGRHAVVPRRWKRRREGQIRRAELPAHRHHSQGHRTQGRQRRKLGWRSLDLEFWKGDEIFLQLTTAADMPAEYKATRLMVRPHDAIITKDMPPIHRDALVWSSPRQRSRLAIQHPHRCRRRSPRRPHAVWKTLPRLHHSTLKSLSRSRIKAPHAHARARHHRGRCQRRAALCPWRAQTAR
jgi:hypothetical protein